MSDDKEKDQKETIENARVGYQAAISMHNTENQEIWNRNMVMTIAQSIFVVAIFNIISKEESIIYYGILSFVGFIICIIWFLIVRNSFYHKKYWVMSARELEETHLSEPVKTTSRGGKFSDGEEVVLTIDKKPYPMHKSFNIKGETLSYMLIAIFAIMYFIIIIISVYKITQLCCKG